MQLVLERGSIDKPLNFDVALIQLSFRTSQCVHLIHAKVFSIQMLRHFSSVKLRRGFALQCSSLHVYIYIYIYLFIYYYFLILHTYYNCL